MTDLSNRSYKKELLDDPIIPFVHIKQNLRELNTINSLLGGHRVSIEGIKTIMRKWPVKKSFTVCEIGCGGGDNLVAIATWCKKNDIAVHCIGIDIKAECIAYAKEQAVTLDATWIISDFMDTRFEDQPDIIFCSLFCHHFTEPELDEMLSWMQTNAALGFVINDLHRHPIAYYSIKIITAVFSNSYLVKNDAPLSVAKGFKIREWKSILAAAGIQRYTLSWKWAFRHLIVCYNG